MTKTSFLVLIASSVTALSQPALAGVQVFPPSDGTYVLYGPQGATPDMGAGVYGVETRGGLYGNWQVGVGPATSQTGYFDQGYTTWTSSDAFTLIWTPTSLSFTVNGITVTSPVDESSGLTQNTIEIGAKSTNATAGTDSITVDDITVGGGANLLAAPVSVGSPTGGGEDSIYFYNSSGWSPEVTLTGYLTVQNTGGSRDEVLFKSGTFTPTVPEPSTWAIMLIGLGCVGAALRSMRKFVRILPPHDHQDRERPTQGAV